MKTKITRLLLSAVLMMCCTVMAWADLGTPPNNEIWYTTDNNSKLTAGKYDVGKPLCGSTIREHGEKNDHYYIKLNANIEFIGENDFDNEDHITEVSLPNTITSIRNKAFNDCDGLVTFHMPNSVINLGYCAFYHCDKLKNLTLGSGLKYIGSYGETYGVFEECDALEAVAIPASVTLLGRNAFYDCNSLKFVAIGSGVPSITEQAFYHCAELKSVVIDNEAGLTIGGKAFKSCEKLESVSFLGNTPPSSFGDECFYDCSPSLKYHVLEEDYGKYNSNSYLSGKVVAGPPYNEIWYSTNNGGTAGRSDLSNYRPKLNAYMGSHGVVFFDGNPPELNSDHYYFGDCTNLVSAVLPSSITYIGKNAFSDCSSLVSVSIPSTVTGIGEHAFYDCYNLQNIKLPDGLNDIGYKAFESCYLRSITIPSGVNNISLEAFSFCSQLRSVTILGTIQNIHGKAFGACSNLSEIYYLGDGTPDCDNSIEYNSFAHCPAIIYVKDVAGHGNYWGDRPVLSWRSDRGDGSAASPLEIGNYQQLYGFSLEVEYMNGANLCAKLTADITGSNNVLNEDGTPKGVFKQWLPIGSWGSVPNTYNGYTGEFDGGGHTVSGLYFNDVTKAPAGLFGMADGAYIHDVGVKDSYFRGKSHVAGICGDLASGRMENCWNAATVQAVNGTAGGMAGSCWRSASLSDCHNTGKVAEGAFCGGVCGSVAKNTAGVTYSVSNCFSLEGKCSVAYNLYEGGVGINNVSKKNAAAFASGEVCYMLNGYQTSDSDKWRQQLGVDGYPTLSGDYFVYYNATSQSYYNHDEGISGSGTADDPYRIGNKFELLKFAYIVNQGNTTACGILTADITINKGVLDSNGNLNSGTFEPWTPIGSWDSAPNTYNGFSGEFNGNGHTISGLYFNDETKAPIGLFGMVDNDGCIHDVGVKDSYFRGKSHVGGICGDLAKGKIENCWNGATVIGADGCAGGLTGSCWHSSTVSGCYNIGNVSSSDANQCGGICGSVAKNASGGSSVTNCVSLEGKCGVAYNIGEEGAQVSNVYNNKDASAFKSGEVCWILNGNQRSAKWRQHIGTDSYPVWTGNYLVNYYNGHDPYYFYQETMCEHSANSIHNYSKATEVKKCDGSTFVYWHCSACGKNYSYEGEGGHKNQTRELSGNEYSGHLLELVRAAVVPTATTTGHYDYWHCTNTNCNKDFLEGDYHNSVTSKQLTVPEQSNNKEIWYTSTNREKIDPFQPGNFGATIETNEYKYGLGKITFDKDVTSIGESAFNAAPDGSWFNGCDDLQSISIPSSVTSIGMYAFKYCRSLQSINIPSGVTSIGAYTFTDCASLQSINIPSDSRLTSIGMYAFCKCHSLQSICIPSGVTSIGKYAFTECGNMKLITFNSLPDVVSDAFNQCKISTKILDLTDSDKPYIGTSLANYPEGGFTEARYHRTLEKDKWGTIVLPFAPTDGMDGLEFYKLKEMATNNGGSLVFTKVETVKAGVPYLFRNTSSTSDFTLTKNEKPAVTVSTTDQTVDYFTLKGSFKQTSLNTTEKKNDNLYYLKENEFWHATGKINIAPFRAYIEGNGAAPAKSFMLIVEDDGEIDAIPGILTDGSIDETEAIYDLNGRRLTTPVKGQVNIIRTKSGKTIKVNFANRAQ